MLTRVVAFRRTEFNICLVLHGLTQIVQIVLTVLKGVFKRVGSAQVSGLLRNACRSFHSFMNTAPVSAARPVDIMESDFDSAARPVNLITTAFCQFAATYVAQSVTGCTAC